MRVHRAVDRHEVLAESYPAARNEIQAMVDVAGGWVCEQHPDRPWPHDSCAGPGMLPARAPGTPALGADEPAPHLDDPPAPAGSYEPLDR